MFGLHRSKHHFIFLIQELRDWAKFVVNQQKIIRRSPAHWLVIGADTIRWQKCEKEKGEDMNKWHFHGRRRNAGDALSFVELRKAYFSNTQIDTVCRNRFMHREQHSSIPTVHYNFAI